MLKLIVISSLFVVFTYCDLMKMFGALTDPENYKLARRIENRKSNVYSPDNALSYVQSSTNYRNIPSYYKVPCVGECSLINFDRKPTSNQNSKNGGIYYFRDATEHSSSTGFRKNGDSESSSEHLSNRGDVRTPVNPKDFSFEFDEMGDTSQINCSGMNAGSCAPQTVQSSGLPGGDNNPVTSSDESHDRFSRSGTKHACVDINTGEPILDHLCTQRNNPDGEVSSMKSPLYPANYDPLELQRDVRFGDGSSKRFRSVNRVPRLGPHFERKIQKIKNGRYVRPRKQGMNNNLGAAER